MVGKSKDLSYLPVEMSIAVLGVGRLGICVALTLEKNGYIVHCSDKNPKIMEAIESRTIETVEPGVKDLLAKSKNLVPVRSLNDVKDVELFFCVVHTPSLPDGSYNHQYLESCAEELKSYLQPNGPKKYFVVCSTTMPGYCAELQEKFTRYNVEVCYNPEFIAQGAILKGMENPDMVLLGCTSDDAYTKLSEIYKRVTRSNPVFSRMKPTEAEITKIAINCFITTKISFANTIGDLCIEKGLNPQRVLDAVGADSRIGRKYLGWGHGFGGPCFPRDNRALSYYCEEQGIQNLIGESTDKINTRHLEFLMKKIAGVMAKDEVNRPLLFRDLSYKPGTTIVEESQPLRLALLFNQNGYTINVEESDEMRVVLETLYPNVFHFVTNPNLKDYIVIDSTLSLLKSYD